MPPKDQLTFLEDKVILIISSVGLVLVSAVVFWVARQSASVRGVPRDEEGEAGLLGGRTRIVPGGREALKAARKEAKKRAKAEFKESSAGLKRRSRVHEKKRPTHQDQQNQGGARKEKPAELLRQVENYILGHKVSPLEAVSDELNVPPAEIAVKIQELETRGAFKGIMIDDARGRGSFVRLGDNEMLALAAVVAERGRLAVADFAAEANRVLQLSGGGEEAEQTARPHSEHQHALGYEAGRQAPCDGCTEGQERNEESAKPSSDGGTAAVVGSSIGAESSSV